MDSESSEAMGTLAENAWQLHRAFGTVAGVSTYAHYTLILAFPSARSDLVSLTSDLKSKSEQADVKCTVNAIQEADMFITKGKAGLLACSLWCLAGAVLVNDTPISTTAAAYILSFANHEEGVHVIGEGLHAAVISRQSDIDHRIMRLPDGHDLEQILRAIGASHGQSRGAKWWRFWE
jgi:hypothetical protein